VESAKAANSSNKGDEGEEEENATRKFDAKRCEKGS
jgi:hypothetical protein